MSDDRIEAEEIARLLDGRLLADERRELMSKLASSDEHLEVLADAIAAQRHSSDATATGEIQARDEKRFRQRNWLAVAAVILALAVLPWAWQRSRGDETVSPSELVTSLSDDARPLSPDWNGTPWSAMRGSAESSAHRALSARLGARLVDLEIAIRSSDGSARQIASDLAQISRQMPAGGALAADFEEIARRADESPERLGLLSADAQQHARSMADAGPFQLGAWLEASRIAAMRKDAQFFYRQLSVALLETWSADSTYSPSVRESLALVRLIVDETPTDWERLELVVTAALRSVGG